MSSSCQNFMARQPDLEMGKTGRLNRRFGSVTFRSGVCSDWCFLLNSLMGTHDASRGTFHSKNIKIQLCRCFETKDIHTASKIC